MLKPNRPFIWTAACAAVFLLPNVAGSWGFWAHKALTRKAITVLPAPMNAFFLLHADSIAERSIDPDLWRRHDDQEGVRHFIDIDQFGSFPYRELPRDYAAAVAKFGEEKVRKAGIVPWRVVEMVDSLSAAMRAKNRHLMIRYASALAHYVEDIHMPLHTVTNYDGQLSGNDGIHSRYERWMLEAKQEATAATIRPDRPAVIATLQDTLFEWVLDSHVWADNLLLADSRSKRPGKVYAKPEDYDAAYYDALAENTRVFTGLQLSRAATAVASCWLTAWDRAGRPELSGL